MPNNEDPATLSPGSAELDADFRRLRDLWALHSDREEAAIMAGYAFGYAQAALEADRPDLAQPKIDWIVHHRESAEGQQTEQDPT
ncbi:hypothetical protein ACIHFD_49720 [Nonomuraea sp. NPDC051941]|uniref:hypothetical protein n=1 Tax=Nonomuraea sp. NPDC051941 TaxID=3364373 RepID=UPI0037C5E198